MQQKPEIFKIQMPLHSSTENPPLLVYNRNRSIYFQLEMTPEIERLMDSKPKIYVLGYIDEEHIFQIAMNKIKGQKW